MRIFCACSTDCFGGDELNLSLICVGKLRERWWREALEEYKKRLSRFGKIEEIEVPDLPEPANSSPATEERICAEEGKTILARIHREDVVIAMAIQGKPLDSVSFAKKLSGYADTGRRIVFVIGGSLGLSPEVLARADMKLSFSPMTFPHQLARVMLAEQLYRACKILAGERYHK